MLEREIQKQIFMSRGVVLYTPGQKNLCMGSRNDFFRSKSPNLGENIPVGVLSPVNLCRRSFFPLSLPLTVHTSLARINQTSTPSAILYTYYTLSQSLSAAFIPDLPFHPGVLHAFEVGRPCSALLPMSHPHHQREVRPCAPPLSSIAFHAPGPYLLSAVCLIVCIMWHHVAASTCAASAAVH